MSYVSIFKREKTMDFCLCFKSLNYRYKLWRNNQKIFHCNILLFFGLTRCHRLYFLYYCQRRRFFHHITSGFSPRQFQECFFYRQIKAHFFREIVKFKTVFSCHIRAVFFFLTHQSKFVSPQILETLHM